MKLTNCDILIRVRVKVGKQRSIIRIRNMIHQVSLKIGQPVIILKISWGSNGEAPHVTVTMIVDPSVSSLFSSNPNAIRSMMILIGSLMNENDDGVVHNLLVSVMHRDWAAPEPHTLIVKVDFNSSATGGHIWYCKILVLQWNFLLSRVEIITISIWSWI